MALLSELCRRSQLDERVIESIKNDVDVQKYLQRIHVAMDEDSAEQKRSLLRRTGIYARGQNKGDLTHPVIDSTSFDYDQQTYIADLAAPVIPGDLRRLFPKVDRKNWLAAYNTEVKSNGEISEGSALFSEVAYVEKGQAHKVKVDLNMAAQSGLDVLNVSAGAVRAVLSNTREMRVASKFMTAANYAGTGLTTALTGNNRWDVSPATSTADPLGDFRRAVDAMAVTPNAIIASPTVLRTLCTHVKVAAPAGPSAASRIVSYEELKQILGVDMILEGSAKYNNAGSSATISTQYVWGKGLWIGRITAGTGKQQVCFAKTVRHTPVRYREVEDMSKGVSGVISIIGSHEDAEVITMDDAGYLIDTVIS